MAISARGRLQDWCYSACCLSYIAAVIAAVDETCRRAIVDALHGELPAMPAALRMSALTRHVTDVLPAGSPSLLALAGAAVVLVLIMFRS
jgi:hypothetical protein